jgi:integrase
LPPNAISVESTKSTWHWSMHSARNAFDIKFAAKDNNQMTKTAKNKTIRNDLVVIKQLLNFAVRRKMIRENPLAELTFPKLKRTPQPYWRRDQVEEILRAASKRYRSLFHFLAGTGVRIGEACWLTWTDIDLGNGSLTYGRKTTGLRSLAMNALSIWAMTCANCWAVCRECKMGIHRAHDRAISVGRPAGFRQACAGAPQGRSEEGRAPGHLHTFRRSFISHALTSGVPEPIVRQWVGHVDHEIIN